MVKGKIRIEGLCLAGARVRRTPFSLRSPLWPCCEGDRWREVSIAGTPPAAVREVDGTTPTHLNPTTQTPTSPAHSSLCPSRALAD